MRLLPAILFFGLVSLAGAPAMLEKLDTNLEGLDAMRCWQGAPNESGMSPFFQAVALACRDDPEGALEAFRDALAQPDARIDVLRLHQPLNLGLAEAAVEQHPEVAESFFWLGDTLAELGRELEAARAYEDGLAIDGTDPDIWDQLGRLYEAAGFLTEAAQAFSQACRYVDRGKNGCLNAGRIFLQLEDYERAEQRFRESLVQLPGFERSYRGLVDTLIARAGTPEGLEYVKLLVTQGDEAAQQALQERSEK